MTVRPDDLVDPQQGMADIVDRLADAKDLAEPASASACFSRALYGLIGLEGSKSAGLVAPPEATNRFRDAVSTALVDQTEHLQEFYSDTFVFALNSANGEWYEACLNRSVLQILMDDFEDTAAANLIGRQDIEDIDELLREAAPQAAPLEDVLLPPGMPPHHWWWTAPSGSPVEPDPEP